MIKNLWFNIFLVGYFSVNICSAGFHEECRDTLSNGRMTIEKVAEVLAEHELERMLKLVEETKERVKTNPEVRSRSESFQQMIQINDDQQPCPQPNNTMFTTTTTRAPSTAAPTTAETESVGTTTQSADVTSAEPSSSVPASESTASSQSSTPTSKSRFPKLYSRKHEDDPFANYMKMLHYYMSRDDHVCNNQITDLNSITEDQLYGYFSTLAAEHPGPFCSLCHRFTEELHTRIFMPNKLLITDDEYHLSNLLYSHVPSAKSICTAIAPGCHEDYALKVGNLTESVVCLECTACMAVTNVVQHKFLLQKQVVDQTYVFLRGNLFHNLCSELCLAFQGFNLTLFPNGFSYDGCQHFFEKKYYQTIEVATVILRPERLCSLELQWCELNEQPNALHCLRELCQEYFKETPQTRWLCSQIPDRPKQADAFLNIRQTKIYKEKKDYHMEFEKRNLHDEL